MAFISESHTGLKNYTGNAGWLYFFYIKYEVRSITNATVRISLPGEIVSAYCSEKKNVVHQLILILYFFFKHQSAVKYMIITFLLYCIYVTSYVMYMIALS